jgi:hypothetical protein
MRSWILWDAFWMPMKARADRLHKALIEGLKSPADMKQNAVFWFFRLDQP